MLLDRALITELLHDLAHRLALTGQPAAVRLVGGTAIAVGYFDRRATLDVDAVYHPGDLVERVAAEIAAERGLPADWLSSHALGFVPFVGQDEWTELFTEGPITVFVASAPMMLAMKLAANRGLRDSGDIDGLLRTCGVTSVEQAQAIYETYHAQGVLSPSAQARVRALLTCSHRRGRGPGGGRNHAVRYQQVAR